MSRIPDSSAQIPANTSSVYALWMKNWPLVSKARISISMPAISPNHHKELPSRSANARIVHHAPTIRNRKPRMSATPANVFLGRTKLMIAAPMNSTPKMIHSHLR